MDSKELLIKELSDINPNEFEIQFKRVPNCDVVCLTDTPLKITTYIYIISEDFTAVVSSNNHCSFSTYNTVDIFKSDRYYVECEGLFKEVYEVIKPLLMIEV